MAEKTIEEMTMKLFKLERKFAMNELAKTNNDISILNLGAPDKVETWAGKYTARITKIFEQPDDSVIKLTRKINKDGSLTDKMERRYK